MRAFWLLCVGFLFTAATATGQSTNPSNISNIIPPSPEVAAIGKYIEMPVSYSSGIPGVSIPFHTVKSGALEVAVGLSYNASGIKVEEASTWAGLGWNLSGGGSISRVVQGLPDDFGSNGYMYTTKTAKYIMALPVGSPERLDLLYNQANNGLLDVEPDMYIFSAGNYSGKFYFDQDLHSFVLTPYQNIVISHTVDANNYIISFKLTLPDGTQCYFGKSKDNLRTGYEKSNGQEVILNSGGTISFPPAGNAIASHITSWQIMDMVAPKGQQIGFQYISYDDVDFGRSGETKDYAGASGCVAATGTTSASYFKQFMTKSRLDKIVGELEDVVFVASGQTRLDVGLEGRSLDKVIIKNKAGLQIKAFEMEYDYFTSPGSDTLPGLTDMTEKARKRLYLKSVKPTGLSTADNTPSYIFTYETSVSLPSRFSSSQDYWGYYNGAQNNLDLIPRVSTYLLYGTYGGYLPGADRTVNFNYAMAGVLKKVTYPTGGTREYFFEPNKVSPAYLQTILNGYRQSGLDNKQFNFFRSTLFQQGSNINLYRGTFTVANVASETQVTSYFEGCPNGYNSLDCPVQVTITGITNPAFQVTVSNPDFYLNLPVGTYQLEAVITPNTNFPTPDFNVAVKWSENPDPNNILVGGLRLAKVVSDDGSGNKLAKSFSYQTFSNPALSSGELINMPVHAFNIPCGNGLSGDALRLVSNSAIPLSSSDGQLVRYTNVTEFYDENKSSFKTEYSFSSDHYNYVDPNGSNYPFPTHLGRDWRSGLVLEKKQYEKQTNGDYRLLTREVNVSSPFQTRYENIFGIKLSPYPTANSFGYTPYSFVSEWYLPSSVQTTVTTYAGGSPTTMTSLQELLYNNQYQVTTQRNQNSKGEITSVNLKYPHDFSAVAPYNEMINRHIINPVVEQTEINVTLNNKEISKTKTNYQFWQSNTFIEPLTIQKSVLGNPLVTEVTINEYDNKGNILQVTGKDEIVTSYIWGYGQQYPVAKVVGKSYSNVLSLSGINLSVINNPADENIMRAELNKLRLITDAFATTYTYKPLVGISSETDPRGRTTYYEYDKLNRLVLVKDHESKIVKKICYNYAGQPEDCLSPCINTTAEWQNTATALRCQLNAGQNTGYQEQEQKDMNPCSPTYNQLRWIQTIYNTTACPLPAACNSGNCSGNDKKCINGVCETGTWAVVSSYRPNKSSPWTCVWAYCFSDGSYSTYTQNTTSSTMCFISCLQ